MVHAVRGGVNVVLWSIQTRNIIFYCNDLEGRGVDKIMK